MGILGLTTFIDKHKNFVLKDFKLHNINIIIDGNNLLYNLYCGYKIGVYDGGEYLTFYDCCKQYLKSFLICSIKMFIVFDGAYDQDGRKFKTALKRDQFKLIEFDKIAHGIKGSSNVVPIFAMNVLNDILNELEIPKITCLTEADQSIASLAKEWNCPILSNDSDFFIYDLPAGLICFDYINLNVVKEDCCYLKVHIYYCTEFKQWAKIKDNDLALLATLLGNDLIDPRQFEQFFARLNGISNKKTEKIKRLLGWLSSKASTESALSYILNCISDKNKDKVKSIIITSIKEYSHPNKTYANLHFKNNHTISTCNCISSFQEIVPYLTVPLAFLLINHNISVRLLEILTNHRLPAMFQIETSKDIATQECSLTLRRILYGSIANSAKDNDLIFIEYQRVGKEIRKKLVRPLFFNDAGTRTFNFIEIEGMKLIDRQKYIVECLVGQIKVEIETYTSDIFYCSVLCYWYNSIQPSESLLQAILLVLFTQPKYNNVETIIYNTSNNNSENYVFCGIDNQTSNEPNNHLKWKNFIKSNLISDQSLKNCTYQFCQFQSILQAADYLNSICLIPFKITIRFDSSLLKSIYNYIEFKGATGLEKILEVFIDIADEVKYALNYIKLHSLIKNIKPKIANQKFNLKQKIAFSAKQEDAVETLNRFSLCDALENLC